MERLKRREGGGWRDGRDEREEDGEMEETKGGLREIEKTKGRRMERLTRREGGGWRE